MYVESKGFNESSSRWVGGAGGRVTPTKYINIYRNVR